MHASIAVGMMLLGGYVYPECEITTIPLKENLSRPSNIQDLEWKEHARRANLPRVPTVDDRQQSLDDKRNNERYPRQPLPPTDPNAARNRPSPMMPTAPTDPGSMQGQRSMPNMPTAPGGGYAGQGGGYQPAAPKNDPYANSQIGRRPVSGYNSQYGAPNTVSAPRASDYSQYNSVNQITSQYGLNSNQGTTAAPGGNKAFNDYKAPSGYSPWLLMNERTNNGTISPYSAYVRPAMDQQNFNSRVSEQINGVQTMQRGYGGSTPGVEVPMGGAGMANPQIFQNYRNYYPQNQ